jgi:DNA-binding transcriptional LysR family regulator
MELRQLRQFYEVCETGSFSAAGSSLYMTQQAVGKSMKQLEDELAVVLFIREKSGVSLTPQGEYLKERCKVILDYIRDTEDQLREIGANCPLRTRIMLPEAVMQEIRTIGESSEAALTDTQFIDCQVQKDGVDEQALEEGSCDALILPTAVQRDDLLAYPLLHVPLCAVFADADKKINKKELSIRDFRGKRVILPSNWIYMKSSLLRAFKEQNVTPEDVISVEDRDEGMRMAEAGDGILILTERNLMNYDKSGYRVRSIPIKKRSFSWNLYYLFRKHDTCQKEILRAYEFLKIRLLI